MTSYKETSISLSYATIIQQSSTYWLKTVIKNQYVYGTSITTLLALLSIYFFGGEILKGFSLAMILGVIFGTYSSIFIANPVLVFLRISQKTILKEDKN